MSKDAAGAESAGELLLRAAAAVPAERYVLTALAIVLAILYRFLELHLISDILHGFRGQRVMLTFHPASDIYHRVASKCPSLHGRYLATPWLASPHLQTLFASIFGIPSSFTYKRELYTARDGGTIALDWLLASDSEGTKLTDYVSHCVVHVVLHGQNSDSASAYMNHLVYSMANKGWNVVVSNHRGLGGVPITATGRLPRAAAFSALDDPLCTREAIPWDECRAKRNVVLATARNGGHLASFQGLTAEKLWWVEAASGFLYALCNSSYMHWSKARDDVLHSSLESSFDKSACANVMEDGMVATKAGPGNDDSSSKHTVDEEVELSNGLGVKQQNETREAGHESSAESTFSTDMTSIEIIAPVKRSTNQLTQCHGRPGQSEIGYRGTFCSSAP